MATPLEKFVKNRFLYLELMQQVGGCVIGQPKHTQLLIDTVTNILTNIKNVKKISVEDALPIQVLVGESSLTAEQKQVVVAALDARVSGPDDIGSGKQNMSFYDKYLTHELAKLFSIPGNSEHKLRESAKHLINLRATRMNEKSWAHCLAVTMQTEQFNGDEKVQILREFKALVEKARGDAPPMGLLEFPAEFHEFRLQEPEGARDAFGDSEPVPSSFDKVSRRLVTAAMPCRSSNAMCGVIGPTKQKANMVPKANRARIYIYIYII